MKITLLSRKIDSGHSIEEIYDSLSPFLGDCNKLYLPTSKITLLNIFKNILFAYKNRGEITHITGDAHYAAIGTGSNTLLTIHDINSAIKGNIIKRFLIKLFWFYIPALTVSKITVVSNFTKNELLKIIPFAKKKIIVVHNPYNEAIIYKRNPFNHALPKILHIGTGQNKNLIRVCDALSDIKCILVIVGILNKEQLQTLIRNNITYINKVNITFDQIANLYIECDIVSFPSLYEGFGMPIIEGNMAGRPVITSNICSMPEIAGDAACLVDPTNVNAIREGFIKILSDNQYRAQLIDSGFKNLERFQPKKISLDYIRIYNQILRN